MRVFYVLSVYGRNVDNVKTMSDFDKTGRASVLFRGQAIGYEVRPSRGRALRIVVHGHDDVVVRVPRGVSLQKAHSFVEQHAEWIRKTLDRFGRRGQREAFAYADGDTLYHLGRPCRLAVVKSVWKGVALEGDELRVSLYRTDDVERVKALVGAWRLAQAKALLARHLEEALARHGDRIRHASRPLALRSAEQPDGLRLTVRPMKTRWGSCTRDGHVTLSAELIQAPPHLIEYVIVHELCHLAHLDHSKAFYFQLAQCLRDWAERRKALALRSWERREPA